MPFIPDAPTKTGIGRFVPDTEEPSISDIPENAAKDIGGMLQGGLKMSKAIVDPANIVESGLAGSMQPTKDYLSNQYQSLKAMPGAIGNEIKQTVQHPINTFIQHPVNTALNVAGAAGLAGEGLGLLGKVGQGAEMAKAGEMAAEAPAVAGAAAESSPDISPLPNRLQEPGGPAEIPSEAQGILNKPPAPPPIVPPQKAPGIGETVSNLKEKIPPVVKGPLDEVSQFLQQKYGKAAEQPGFGETIGDIALRKSQSMRFKEMGASPGQIRKLIDKLGEDKVRGLSDLAEEKGITKPIVGYKIGKNIDNLAQSAGQAIGGIREIAAKRGAVHDPEALVSAIRQELDPIYLGKGSASSQKGMYLKSLEDIKSAKPTADGLAKKISWMNDQSTANKMTQATGAQTDVANTASRINNDLIHKYLSPQEADFYKSSLRDYGASQIYKKFYGFRAGRELSGRAGPGGIMRNIKQAAMDAGGNKLMEKALDKFGNRMKANPGLANDIGTMSHQAFQDLLSSLDEVIDETVK